MVTDVYRAVKISAHFVRMGIKLKYQRQLGVFLSAASLEIVAIDVLRPLLRTKTGNQFAVIVKD